MSMKVAHIYWDLTYGGIQTMLVNIINEQVKLGVDVSLIIVNDVIADELLNAISPRIKIIRIHRKAGSKNFSFVYRIKHALDEINPDIIHSHKSALLNFIPKKCYKRTCNTVHDLPVGKIGPKCRLLSIYKWQKSKNENVLCLDRIKSVFAISQSVHDQLEAKYHIASKVVYNGIETTKFRIRPNLSPVGSFNIVQISRLEHVKKGQDLLIEAFDILWQKRRNVKLTFIGQGKSLEHLKKLAHQQGGDNQIEFKGAMPQSFIAEHLCDYEIFVQPSRHEGFGLTVAEAMAAKVPVLVSSGQGPEEVTEGEKYGWTFENGNAEDLAKKLLYIIEHYDECLDKAEQAYHHVKDNYDVSVTAKKYIDAYKKIIE